MNKLISYIFLLLSLSVNTVQGTNVEGCPVTVPNCYCRLRYTHYLYLICENLGNVTSLPEFTESHYRFEEFSVLPKSSVQCLRNKTFFGIKAKGVYLEELRLKEIKPGAFVDLGNDLLYLYLRGNDLEDIPPLTFKTLVNLQYLGLQDNQFTSLKKEWFDTLEFLTVLNLRGNDIQRIETGTFNGLLSLNTLDLGHNHIHHTGKRVFAVNPDLSELVLSYNNISSLQSDIFSQNNVIRSLELSHNQFDTFPQDISTKLYNCRYLDLSHNVIQELSQEVMGDLLSLTYLDISANQIMHINNSKDSKTCTWKYLRLQQNMLYTVSNKLLNRCAFMRSLDMNGNNLIKFEPIKEEMSLRDLNLASNSVKTLEGDMFSGLRYLAYLNISYNKIQSIVPSAFYGLERLRSLDLTGNNIEKLDGTWVKDLSSLSILYLSHNDINTMSSGSMRHLKSMTYLSLRGNHIHFIAPMTFYNNRMLTNLMLSNNALNQVSKHTFKGLSRLEYLYLDHNEMTSLMDEGIWDLYRTMRYLNISWNNITMVEEYSLISFQKLEVLDISNNNIENITSNSFANKKLKILDMSYNSITDLVASHLSGLSNLMKLDVSYNRIQYIGIESLQPCANLQILEIKGNPFFCGDCLQQWIFQDSRVLQQSGSFICNSPVEYKYQDMECVLGYNCRNRDVDIADEWSCNRYTSDQIYFTTTAAQRRWIATTEIGTDEPYAGTPDSIDTNIDTSYGTTVDIPPASSLLTSILKQMSDSTQIESAASTATEHSPTSEILESGDDYESASTHIQVTIFSYYKSESEYDSASFKAAKSTVATSIASSVLGSGDEQISGDVGVTSSSYADQTEVVFSGSKNYEDILVTEDTSGENMGTLTSEDREWMTTDDYESGFETPVTINNKPYIESKNGAILTSSLSVSASGDGSGESTLVTFKTPWLTEETVVDEGEETFHEEYQWSSYTDTTDHSGEQEINEDIKNDELLRV